MMRGKSAATGALLAGVLLILGACETVSPETDRESRADSEPTGQQAREAADPIARFATNAPQGATSQVSYQGSTIWVTVGPYYQSAAGDRCRRVTMRGREGSGRLSAVCRDNGVWRTVITY
jgi:hypothetical protein